MKHEPCICLCLGALSRTERDCAWLEVANGRAQTETVHTSPARRWWQPRLLPGYLYAVSASQGTPTFRRLRRIGKYSDRITAERLAAAARVAGVHEHLQQERSIQVAALSGLTDNCAALLDLIGQAAAPLPHDLRVKLWQEFGKALRLRE